MNKQIPAGWNKWIVWIRAGIEDDSTSYHEILVRLKRPRGRERFIRWGHTA